MLAFQRARIIGKQRNANQNRGLEIRTDSRPGRHPGDLVNADHTDANPFSEFIPDPSTAKRPLLDQASKQTQGQGGLGAKDEVSHLHDDNIVSLDAFIDIILLIVPTEQAAP